MRTPQLFATCRLIQDRLTGNCVTRCLDESKCSAPQPCPFKPLRSVADFAYYQNCEEACSLHLDDLDNFDPTLFNVFKRLRRIRGTLSVTNNKYLYTLEFLSGVEQVGLCTDWSA
jgi:hypothetical protein